MPGALNIPVDELDGRLGELDAFAGDEVIVHCESGRRAARAEAMLREAGFAQVVDLEGHMRGWRAAGLPTESE